MKRRSFLRNTGLASAAILVPKFLTANPWSLAEGQGSRKLIVIQLSGGNDGLNTIVPYADDLYHNARPSLAWHETEVIKIHEHFGLNPGLEALHDLYDQGEWSIINNVGYPNPDRSHFRSMDIWHTASGSEKYLNTGWLGRYLDHTCSVNCAAHQAIEMGDELSLALKGTERDGFVVDNISSIKMAIKNPYTRMKSLAQGENENLDYLFKVLIETQQSADYLLEKSKVYTSKVSYPLGKFGNDLKKVAELINSGNNTSIYYLDLSGFDTHVFQKNKQKRLLKTYAEGVASFVEDLKMNGNMDDVLIMTFSEFGRRVKENASGGTDHGTANNVFLMGTGLKHAGLYMDSTDLGDLDKGDLKYKIDFRRVYAEVLENWLGTTKGEILSGKFETLGVV
jgi:uncharacterized protein (DUF1501 family)